MINVKKTSFHFPRPVSGAFLMLALVAFAAAPARLRAGSPRPGADDLPNLKDMVRPQGIMPGIIERYEIERGDSAASAAGWQSPEALENLKSACRGWLEALTLLDFDGMSQEDKVDYLLFKHSLDFESSELDGRIREAAETASFVPFAETIMGLERSRRRQDPMDPVKTAAAIDDLRRRIEAARGDVEARGKAAGAAGPGKEAGAKAGEAVNGLRKVLADWFAFYNGYDPLFTWWVDAPFKAADAALKEYASFLYEKIAGAPQPREAPAAGPRPGGRPQVRGSGSPIGRQALAAALAREMIPYTPDQVIAIGESEFAWCEAEMKKDSRAMGFGDDWHKALEHVKTLHLQPGEQPKLIHDLAVEAIRYLDDNDLITLPDPVRTGWDIHMMSPERQLTNPFFSSVPPITISFPADTMSHEQKLMSMRGNNVHFARATVFHELIPGHYLQRWMGQRYRPYRRPFGTAFYSEGWALYWEMVLYDMGFPESPENRIGMLFWRMHRAARIIFSLNYHLGKMTQEECIDMLVDRVGHERENAAGEVRRSFNGQWDPLYQAAYMIGGLQIRSLRKELVDSGAMTNRAFHDRILRENAMPIAMLRALMTDRKLSRDFKSDWKFYGPNPGGR